MEFKSQKFYSVKQLISANGGPLDLSLSAIYAAVRSGEIPSIKIGRRLLIPGYFIIELEKKSTQIA